MILWAGLWALVATIALADQTSYFTGQGTSYQLNQVSSGSCNLMYESGDADNYAALNDAQWNSTRNCGRCAEISCGDDRCKDKTSSALVYLVDRCPNCQPGDLDLSPTVFQKLTGSTSSRYSIKWKFVACPVRGNIQYCTKSGSNSSWLALQPTNLATGVANLRIAHQSVTMVDSCYYYLLAGGQNVDLDAVPVEVTSVTGEILTETVKLSPNSCTEGTANFDASSTQQMDTNSSISVKQKVALDSSEGGTYKAGKVSASDVSILEPEKNSIADMLETQHMDASNVQQATTSSGETSVGTSPVAVLIVLAVVATVAAVAIAFSVKKKIFGGKRVDFSASLNRSFDTFSSPVRLDESVIAKI
ncbi:hypothetical protein CCR75_005960 [Bremia lactucae]|uniref:Expansin-like EG45 domain-containing protein n=1 Tax=Bremia lactucae TaxID=4779 RepID=A0A976FMX6_BRELC|nr:hypothetical protein CCR75_005960 [Bremia lactucae]